MPGIEALTGAHAGRPSSCDTEGAAQCNHLPWCAKQVARSYHKRGIISFRPFGTVDPGPPFQQWETEGTLAGSPPGAKESLEPVGYVLSSRPGLIFALAFGPQQ